MRENRLLPNDQELSQLYGKVCETGHLGQLKDLAQYFAVVVNCINRGPKDVEYRFRAFDRQLLKNIIRGQPSPGEMHDYLVTSSATLFEDERLRSVTDEIWKNFEEYVIGHLKKLNAAVPIPENNERRQIRRMNKDEEVVPEVYSPGQQVPPQQPVIYPQQTPYQQPAIYQQPMAPVIIRPPNAKEIIAESDPELAARVLRHQARMRLQERLGNKDTEVLLAADALNIGDGRNCRQLEIQHTEEDEESFFGFEKVVKRTVLKKKD